jgi:putative phosphoesterase
MPPRSGRPSALARLRTGQVKVASPGDRDLRIAVVADSHGAPHPRAYALLRDRRPDVILHAGDIGGPDIVSALAAIAPTHAVRGNIDDHLFPDDLVVDVGYLKLLLTHIAVYGPKLRADVGARARAAKAAIVVCGHSHVPFVGRDQGLVVFNPGSLGPRRFSLPILFGVVELGKDGMRFEHVSCETGERWLPP